MFGGTRVEQRRQALREEGQFFLSRIRRRQPCQYGSVVQVERASISEGTIIRQIRSLLLQPKAQPTGEPLDVQSCQRARRLGPAIRVRGSDSS